MESTGLAVGVVIMCGICEGCNGTQHQAYGSGEALHLDACLRMYRGKMMGSDRDERMWQVSRPCSGEKSDTVKSVMKRKYSLKEWLR